VRAALAFSEKPIHLTVGVDTAWRDALSSGGWMLLGLARVPGRFLLSKRVNNETNDGDTNARIGDVEGGPGVKK
jgi:hypothetical protein